jgi:endonuclease/exonuclease/phosphatase (EEP) superfamily protein YafD
VVTGDFNQTIDGAPGPNPLTVAAVRAFLDEYGYTDVARDKGATRDQRRIDYILVRGVKPVDTVRFVSHESDHRGLATTIDPGTP